MICNKRGLTLIEALVSVGLVGTLMVTILGAFIISRLGVDRAKHRMMAMNTIRAYMEQEIKSGRLGGYVSGNNYVSVTSANPITFTVDDNGTTDTTADDLTGTIKPDPYPAELGYYKDGVMFSGEPSECQGCKQTRFKKIGFVVEWTEKQFGGGNMPTSRERAAAYVADHS